MSATTPERRNTTQILVFHLNNLCVSGLHWTRISTQLLFNLLFSDYEPQSISEHLQYLFALLQNSNRKYIDPSGLVKALGLDTGQQQVHHHAKLMDDYSVKHVSPKECWLLLFSGCPGVFQALPVSAGKHAVQTTEQQPAERHPEAILWTVLLCDSVRRLFLIENSVSRPNSLLKENLLWSLWFSRS